MKAIEFQLDVTKLLQVRFGESSFKLIDEFWTDFKPDGGEKTTSFIPCVVPDTEGNRNLIVAISQVYIDKKKADDDYERLVLKLRNQLKR